MQIPENLQHTTSYTIVQMIVNGKWNLPEELKIANQEVVGHVMHTEIGNEDKDMVIWMGSLDRKLTIKTTFDFYREKSTETIWFKKLWRNFLPLKISLLAWRICIKYMPTSIGLARRGLLIRKVCLNCIQSRRKMRIISSCNVRMQEGHGYGFHS